MRHKTSVSESRVIEIKDIGRVALERSRRARRVVIYIKPFKDVKVTVPMGESFKTAEDFVLSKVEWLKRRLKEMREYEKRQEEFRSRFSDIDIDGAKKELPRRLGQLAEKHGFQYGRVTIRQQKTRWGSCSRKNNISLNANLMGLPDDLRDYVILHELVHTRVHNHSRKFWAELDKYVPNARATAKKLRENGLELV